MSSFRIGVLSDVHGDTDSLRRCMQAMPDLNLCFFLGDVAGDAATIRLLLAQRTPVPLLWAVRGNCDFATTLPEKLTVEAAGRKIFATHGHLYGVGYGLERLLLAADALNVSYTRETVTVR